VALQPASLTGFTTSIKSYERVEGILLRPAEAVVRYGTLVEISDASTGSVFLGMIVDVKEETPHPALDVERLRKLFEGLMASTATLEDAIRVLEEITSPTQELVKWSSIMNVEVRVLGEVRGESLEPYDRPPRPFSRISYPGRDRLERVLHARFQGDYRSGGVYVGRLSYNPDVNIYMIPSRLTTHLSVLGQTGAGKTETVKRLVFEVSRRRPTIGYPHGGIVVFDVAGEYTGYPYEKEDTVPLLDAVLNPRLYAREPPFNEPEKTTIIVPYEASRLSGKASTNTFIASVRELACSLAKRTGKQIDYLVLLDFERRLGRAGPDCAAAKEAEKASYRQAYKTIKQSQFLIIALPLPGFMDVDTMVELSGTGSEYFPVIISEIASALDLHHGEDIYGIRLLLTIVESMLRNGVNNMLNNKSLEEKRGKWPPIVKAFKSYCSNRDDNELVKELKRALKFESSKRAENAMYAFLRYLAWLSYRHGYADPTTDSEWKATCKLLDDENGFKLAAEKEESLYYAARDLAGMVLKGPTLPSAFRALKKLAQMTSDIVDTVTFDAIMERLSQGFSIVHLAPPSLGNVDTLLSTLIRRLFGLHVGNYDPQRLTILVAEEAHNLAPANEERASKTALLRVAREGRKWGLSLWLVSQRPAFIDSGVLSQAATSILLRTTNPDDLSTVKRGVESAAAEVVDRLPDLEPTRGEALLVGLAAPERRVPLLVMIEKLSK